jgi:hypothetical protein
MRYRGPFEYDKFVLNILQFHNEINQIFIEEFNLENSNKSRLINSHEGIKRIYNETTSKSEELYLRLLNYKE